MEDGCVHCSLVTPAPAIAFDPSTITTFLLPGLVLLLISLRWSCLLLTKWSRVARQERLEAAGLPAPPLAQLHSALPWEGLAKTLTTVLAILVLSALPPTLAKLPVISMLGCFLLSGLVDILVFYCGYAVLPEGIQSFILAGAFAAETLCYSAVGPAGQAGSLLLFTTALCALSAALEVGVNL